MFNFLVFYNAEIADYWFYQVQKFFSVLELPVKCDLKRRIISIPSYNDLYLRFCPENSEHLLIGLAREPYKVYYGMEREFEKDLRGTLKKIINNQKEN